MCSTESPLFTVIMATYGRGRHILPSVRSVIAQDLPDFELLVVGDACPADTPAALEPLLSDRVRWMNLPVRSRSQSGPNNEGIRIARGQLIAYLGHDDIWEPGHLSALARVFAEQPDLHFAVSGAVYHLPHGIPGSIVTGLFVDDSAKHVHFFPPSSFAHRATVTTAIGPWRSPEATSAAVDCDLLRRAAAADLRFASTRRITVHKFAAGHRYLSYLVQESHEQEAMLAAIGTRSHADRVDMIVARALVGGTYMSAGYDDDDRERPGENWRANLTRKGLRVPDVQSLAETLVVKQSPSFCALDWDDDVRSGLRWSLRSPRPKILVPVTAPVVVRADLEIAHEDPDALVAFPLLCNGDPVEVLGCTPRALDSRPARAILSFMPKLLADRPSVLELLLPEPLVPTDRRRGIAIGDMIVTARGGQSAGQP